MSGDSPASGRPLIYPLSSELEQAETLHNSRQLLVLFFILPAANDPICGQFCNVSRAHFGRFSSVMPNGWESKFINSAFSTASLFYIDIYIRLPSSYFETLVIVFLVVYVTLYNYHSKPNFWTIEIVIFRLKRNKDILKIDTLQ